MLVFDFFKESKIETFTKPLDAWLRQPQALAAGIGEVQEKLEVPGHLPESLATSPESLATSPESLEERSERREVGGEEWEERSERRGVGGGVEGAPARYSQAPASCPQAPGHHPPLPRVPRNGGEE